MVRFLAGRLLSTIAVLLGVTTLTFGLLHLSGDPLAGLVPPGAPPEQLAATRHRLGLDRPIPVQYARFVTRGTW